MWTGPAKAKRYFADWRAAGGITRRITLSAMALSMLMVAGGGLISFGALYQVQRQSIDAELDGKSHLLQQQFERNLNSVASDIAKLAASAWIANGLTDATGRDAYLLPRLREHKLTLPYPAALVLYDVQGRPIASSLQRDLAGYNQIGAVRHAIETSRPWAGVQHDANGKRSLRLLYPITSPPAIGKAKGALLGVVDLDAIFKASTLQLNPEIERDFLAMSDAAGQHRAWHDDEQYIMRAWRMKLPAPLDTLDLQVRIGQEKALAFAALKRAAVAYCVFGVLVFLLTLLLARRIGQLLTVPLSELKRTANALAAGGSIDIKTELKGNGEIARTFNHMLEQLQARESEFKTLVESLQLANRAIESSVNPIVIVSCLEPDYPVKYVNPAFERVTGYSRMDVVGRNCRFLQGDDHAQPELELIRAALREQQEVRVVLRNYRKDGKLFWNELYIAPVREANGTVTHFVGEITDITESREQQEQLHHQASHDTLTGLPNRSLLIDRLMQATSFAQRYQSQVVVAFLDLDNFKPINDSLGHAVGDDLLQQVAQRLSSCVRESDTVARLGGDEFVLVLYDQANEDITYQAMQRVLTSISEPMQLAGREYTITCSIGFAIYPQDGADAETLLKNADTAMYRAKELGRDNFQFYTEELNIRINDRMALEAGLRQALVRNEFVLHYQPQIDLDSGKVSGVEALIRWNHPELGLVLPSHFIPLAEEVGLIHQIGDWAMRSACLQHKAWQREGVADLPVAVNISAPQFFQKNFAQTVAAVLHDTGVQPARLELEITESLSMRNPETTIRVLQELKEMGVKLVIDDFGTGYSNLSYLKQFPIDKIKVAQSFVRDVVHNHQDLAISDAVIAMAHSLRLKVSAEGIESATQLALLADHGCDEMQGFYFSPAVPADACTALLQENHALPIEKLGRNQGKRTLLLIDDEPNVLAALERALRRTGCQVLTAPHAMAAFDLLAMHEVGVILCDQRMPMMTGVEFFGRIRHMYPTTVRIILSGYADISAVTDAINLGAVYKFLNKPWEGDALCAVIDEAFEKYQCECSMANLSALRRDAGF